MQEEATHAEQVQAAGGQGSVSFTEQDAQQLNLVAQQQENMRQAYMRKVQNQVQAMERIQNQMDRQNRATGGFVETGAPSYEEAMRTAQAIQSGLKNIQGSGQQLHPKVQGIYEKLQGKNNVVEELTLQELLKMQKELATAEGEIASTPHYHGIMEAVNWCVS